MRVIYFIFSIYFLVLSCIPCGDTRDCNEPASVEHEITYADNHDKHDHDAETCSVLCTCSCCGCVTNLPEYLSVDFKLNISSKDSPIHNTDKISEISFSIWQPPKIS